MQQKAGGQMTMWLPLGCNPCQLGGNVVPGGISNHLPNLLLATPIHHPGLIILLYNIHSDKESDK